LRDVRMIWDGLHVNKISVFFGWRWVGHESPVDSIVSARVQEVYPQIFRVFRGQMLEQSLENGGEFDSVAFFSACRHACLCTLELHAMPPGCHLYITLALSFICFVVISMNVHAWMCTTRVRERDP
jgi:hypothetical protein